MKVVYASRFLKQLAKTDDVLVEEIYTAIESFKNKINHKALKVHKLKGTLKNVHAFSVNYKIRVLFYYPEKDVAELVMLGTHDEVYRS